MQEQEGVMGPGKKAMGAGRVAVKARKSVTLKVRVWLGERDRRIRLVSPSNFISTVADTPGKRYHPHLYGKLRAILKKQGKWVEEGR